MIRASLVAAVFLLHCLSAPGQTQPKNQQNLDEMMRPQTIQGMEVALFNTRQIPSASGPYFDDPVAREDATRMHELASETPGAAVKSLGDRVKAVAAQHGPADSRTITALEDAWLMTRSQDAPAARAFLDQAIKLREREGVKSVAYWKDLQRRCMTGFDPKDCKQALEVRMQQPDVTPLELAIRAQTAGPAYADRMPELFAKVPGISPLFIATLYRQKCTMALLGGKTAEAIQFNDLTNRFLAEGDAAARNAILPSETLRLIEAEKSRAALPARGGSALEPGQDDLLDGFVQAYRLLTTGQITPPIRWSTPAVTQAVLATGSADEVRSSCERGDGAGSREAGMAMFRSQGALNEGLQLSAASGNAPISILLFRCAPGSSPRAAASPISVRTYAMMSNYKGMFAEMIAPRKMTVMPGHSEEVTEALKTSSEARSRALMAAFPPVVQQRLLQLPPDERKKVAMEMLQTTTQTLSKVKLPPDLVKHLQQLPQQERIQAFRDYIATHKDLSPEQYKDMLPTVAMVEMIQSQGRASRVVNDHRSDDQPLAFLNLLQPHEVLVDIYKYRPRDNDHFGPEHYLAVVSDRGGSSRMVPLGSAQAIDSVIHTFLSGFAGTGQRDRGVTPVRGGASEGANAWKTLQQTVVQPIVDAIPAGTERILISPDSSYALVPFASLFLEMGVSASIAVMPSSYDLARLRASPAAPATGKALLVGGLDYGQGAGKFQPLVATGLEVKSVAELATGAGLKTTTLSGTQATRAAIISQVRDTQLLHFATHGEWEVQGTSPTAVDAFRSAHIALSRANSGSAESLLTAGDIVNLDLSAVQLVTLSACSSGQGRPVDSQGLLGFQTAFMAAGARAILVSLWSVPDEATALLMQSFYSAALQNSRLTKAEALRKAQEKVRSDPRFADPRNWAAWVLIGEGW